MKIGDFSRAQYISSNQPSQDDSIVIIDESTPLISSDCNCFMDDLLAAARVIFIIATGKEIKDETDNLTELPDANYAILYLSLQEGLSAAEAGQLPPFQALTRRLSLLSKLKKERIQAIVCNTKREIGQSIWSTSPEVILQEFALLIPVEDVSTLPYILSMAYDLCNVPMDDIQFIRMLLRAFAFLDNSEREQHFDPDMIIIELDKFGQWIPDFDLVIEDSGVTTMTLRQKGKVLALLIQFVHEWFFRHEELRVDDLRQSSIKDVEINSLSLSLQEGLTASEALLSPLFHSPPKEKISHSGKVTCTLNDYLANNDSSNIQCDAMTITKHLLQAVDEMHSSKQIIHGKINTHTIFLQLDESRQFYGLCLGDFSMAQFIPESRDSPHERHGVKKDLKAVAQVMSHLVSGTSNTNSLADLKVFQDIDHAILYLSLKEGLPAGKALKLPPFHVSDIKRKMSLLTKLDKERISLVVSNVNREIGKSIWTTSPAMILQEFVSICMNSVGDEDITSLPHVLRLAYDLCDVPINDSQFIHSLLRAASSDHDSIQIQHLKPNLINLELDRFGQWIPEFDTELLKSHSSSGLGSPPSISSSPTSSSSSQSSSSRLPSSGSRLPSSSSDEVLAKGKALAQLNHLVREWKIKGQDLSMEDLPNPPTDHDIEMHVLMLSLQEGLAASEALLTPPFQHELKKKSVLEELNAFLKQIKCERNKKINLSPSKPLQEAEKNARLVIGGGGAWNVLLNEKLLHEFAANKGYGYNLVSYADLLRIIRNIFQHGHEEPETMLAAFGTENPSPTQMMRHFCQLFPFFFPHSVSCFAKCFERRPDSVPELYVRIYDQLEEAICARGIADGMLKPMKKRSNFTLRFESLREKVVEEVFEVDNAKTPSSCLDVFVDVVPKLMEKSAELWQDVLPETLIIVTSRGKALNIPKAVFDAQTRSSAMVSGFYQNSCATVLSQTS